MGSELNNRHSIRLKYYDYSQQGIYYITMCLKEKQPIFGEVFDGAMILNGYGTIAENQLKELGKKFSSVNIDEYVIMPDHVHVILQIGNDTVNPIGAIHELPLQKAKRRRMLIPQIIGYYKMNVAKQINLLKNTQGTALWQRNYYEHVIRNDEELFNIRSYIINNPLNGNESEEDWM